jgi:hypothetical protein
VSELKNHSKICRPIIHHPWHRAGFMTVTPAWISGIAHVEQQMGAVMEVIGYALQVEPSLSHTENCGASPSPPAPPPRGGRGEIPQTAASRCWLFSPPPSRGRGWGEGGMPPQFQVCERESCLACAIVQTLGCTFLYGSEGRSGSAGVDVRFWANFTITSIAANAGWTGARGQLEGQPHNHITGFSKAVE